ncbi:response regulator transcription factor [Dyadobacter sp. CY312]|uniref:response regulator transcription factor n=1 Tax=Dyadobacter sp. CY312 TaxID=2907303 RepID=UPI001F301729|nr:response regulator transcription factor [Dyadobacter sp. CY312]MCE7044210.1 response regulator transcription factor [Dyadobacter sp. CY312]
MHLCFFKKFSRNTSHYFGPSFQTRHDIPYLKTGPSAYISKDSTLEELTRCISTVRKGNRYLHPDNWDDFLELIINNDKPRPKQGLLSPRQQEIAELFSKGVKTGRIAKQLGLHNSTVSTVKATIYKKPGVNNTNELKKVID